MFHIGEEKTDMAYWGTSMPLRIYMRVFMSLTACLYAGCISGWLGLPDTIQWAAGTIAGLFVLFFRVLFPNGFSAFLADVSAKSDQARAELADGNFDGVPKPLTNNMHYPTQDEIRTAKESLEEFKVANKNKEKTDKKD